MLSCCEPRGPVFSALTLSIGIEPPHEWSFSSRENLPHVSLNVTLKSGTHTGEVCWEIIKCKRQQKPACRFRKASLNSGKPISLDFSCEKKRQPGVHYMLTC